MSTFVIGDIHGCYDTFMELLARISPNPQKDFLIFLGDYIDRGPDSNKVIAELLHLQQEFDHFIALKGNHEQMFFDFLAEKDRGFYLMMGGDQTLESYGIKRPWPANIQEKIPNSHLTFFQELLDYWEDENNIYVHAGLQPDLPLYKQKHEWLFWARRSFVDSENDFGKRVIYGHTPFPSPKIDSNKIGIDTGAVYGGSLTCLILPDMEFVTVPLQ